MSIDPWLKMTRMEVLAKRIAGLFPGRDASLQYFYIDVTLVDVFFRQPGGGCFIRSSTIKNDFLIFGQGWKPVLERAAQDGPFK
jgi:hypothetical protein